MTKWIKRENFIYFMLYAFVGWAYEVFLEVVVYGWGYSDRGVLFGPYCPIYGVGAFLLFICLNRLIEMKLDGAKRWFKPVAIFVCSMAVATALELAASYALEALTGGWPWQTYVNYAINFQGRIALSPSVRFGLGGILFIYVLQPFFEKIVSAFNKRRVEVFASALVVVFAADVCTTVAFKLL